MIKKICCILIQVSEFRINSVTNAMYSIFYSISLIHSNQLRKQTKRLLKNLGGQKSVQYRVCSIFDVFNIREATVLPIIIAYVQIQLC